jgi:uncharacterized membrane protein
MNDFKRGTPGFGILLGCIFVLGGGLIMWIGIWKTLILIALFAAGYFIGAVKNKSEFVRETVNRVVPEKKDNSPIDFRKEIEKEQEVQQAQGFRHETEQSDKDEE